MSQSATAAPTRLRPNPGAARPRGGLTGSTSSCRRTSTSRRSSCSSAVFGVYPLDLHRLGVAARLEPDRRRHTLRRPRQLRRAAHRRVLLERGRQHVRHVPRLDRPAAAAGADPGQPAQPGAARPGRSSGWASDAERHLGRRGRHRLRQLFARDFGLVNWLLDLSASTRSTGAANRCRPGSPSRSWSTGAGPATTR